MHDVILSISFNDIFSLSRFGNLDLVSDSALPALCEWNDFSTKCQCATCITILKDIHRDRVKGKYQKCQINKSPSKTFGTVMRDSRRHGRRGGWVNSTR